MRNIEEIKKEMEKTAFLEDGCAFDESSFHVPNLFFNPIAALKYAISQGKDVEDLTLRELDQFRIDDN